MLKIRLVQQLKKTEFILRQAVLYAHRGKLETLRTTLTKIKSKAEYLIPVVKCEADIQLTVFNDSQGYLNCFSQNLANHPLKNFLLGNAYAKLHRYDEAIQLFQSLQINPDVLDSFFHALIDSHYYSDAAKLIDQNFLLIKNDSQKILRYAKILAKIKKTKEALLLLSHSSKFVGSAVFPIVTASYYKLLGRIKMNASSNAEAFDYFALALKVYQEKILSEGSGFCFDYLRRKAAKICCFLGSLSTQRDKAFENYTLGHKFDPNNQDALIALVNFHKSRLDLTKCMTLCREFIDSNPDCEAVALLMTNLETKDYSVSIDYLGKVLKVKPNLPRVIVRLIEIASRGGRVQAAAQFVNGITFKDIPGLIFCKGLFCLYSGKIADAEKNFLHVLNDRKWGENAKNCMFLLKTNPNRQFFWTQNEPLTSQEAIEEAQKYLKQNNSLQVAQVNTSINSPDTIETAFRIFTEMYEQDKFSISARIGLAGCYVKQQQYQKASDIIEFVFEEKPFHDNFAYFVEAYLLKAYILVQGKQHRAAQQYIFIALDLNLSCMKGWEMCGEAHFQNKLYQEAASSYQRCWELGGKTDIRIGQKLAHSLLLAGKPDLSLSVCRILLNINPLIEGLKETILIPAYRLLK